MFTEVIALLKKHPFLFVSNLFGLFLFADMAEDVIEKEYILVIDRWVSIHVNDVQTPVLNQIMVTLTNLNGTIGILLFSLVVVLFLLYKKWYKDMWFYLISIGGAAIAFIFIKLIVQRVRPGSDIINVSGYSFPSGHSTMAMTVVLAIYFIFAKRIHVTGVHMVLLFVCLLWAFIIAASRIYLDVHWLSDVIAGMGLGLFWVTLVALFFKWKYQEQF